MVNEMEALKLLNEIEVLQERMAKRLAKGKENYTEEDTINAAKDDILCKELMERINKFKK